MTAAGLLNSCASALAEAPGLHHAGRFLLRARPAIGSECGHVLNVDTYPHAVAPASLGQRCKGSDELGSDPTLPSGGHDAQLVQEHLGALIRVRGLHAGDHPDHGSAVVGLIVVREQQVMAGAAEKPLGRGGLGRLVEEWSSPGFVDTF